MVLQQQLTLHCIQQIGHAPVIYCFPIREQRSSNFSEIFNICDDSSSNNNNNSNCAPFVRFCSSGENPNDILYDVVGPLGFGLLLLSFGSTLFLYKLGNYYTMYKWSNTLFRCYSIVHFALLFDFLRNNKTLEDPNLKSKLTKILTKTIRKNPKIIDQKDPLHGGTLMHAALDGDHYGTLEMMLKLGGDFYSKDRYQGSILSYVTQRFSRSREARDALNGASDLLNPRLRFGAEKQVSISSTIYNRLGQCSARQALYCGGPRTF